MRRCCRHADCTRSAAASADRHWVVPDRAAVAAVHPHRHPDCSAGAVRAAGLLPGGKIAVPAMAVVDPVRAMWMFVGTMALLLLPKLFGCVAVLVSSARTARLRRHVAVAGWAGAGDDHCGADGAGCDADTDDRCGGDFVRTRFGLEWNGAMAARSPCAKQCGCTGGTLLGVLLGRSGLVRVTYLAAWMLPVVLGLALAIPMVLWTGRASPRAVLLRTPDQTAPPPIVSRAAALQREWQAMATPDVAALLNGKHDCCACMRRCCHRSGDRASTRSTSRCWWRGPSWMRRMNCSPRWRR